MADNKLIEEAKERVEKPYREYPTKPEPTFNLDLKEVLALIVSKWYWFVISLAFTLGIATVYLMRTPPTYEASAQLLLKNAGKDKESSIISDLGIGLPKNDVYNELFVLESPLIMGDVVTRLGLNNRYYTKDGLRLVDLYKNTPVIVTAADTISMPNFQFRIRLDGNKNFEIYGFPGDDETVVTGSLGQTVQTPLGMFTLLTSPWYNGNPYTDSEIIYSHVPVETAAQTFSAGIIAESLQAGTDVILLTQKDQSRQRAIDILDTMIEVYGDKNMAEQLRSAQSANDFLTKRLAILEDDLSSVDGDISSYKSSNQLPDVGMSSSLYFNRAFTNQTELLDVHAQLQMAQFIRRELSNESIENTLPVNTGLQSLGIQTQIAEYNQLVIERNRLLSSGTESNPVISELTTTLTTMKQNMVRSLDNFITSLNHQLGNLETTDSKASNELTANPDREKYLLSVERQQKVKEQLYMFLLQKREEGELSQAYIQPNISVVRATSCANAPIAPRRFNIYLIAIAVGFIAPILLLLLFETLNTTVRDRRDLGDLSIPLLGEIPFGPGRRKRVSMRKKLRSAGPENVVVKEGSNNVINEAFRAIRTSLEFMTSGSSGTGHVVAFTSACSGSGKTFIVMNLAKTLALANKKVLVVDLDLRKASLSKWAGRTDRGISNYLIGQTDFQNLIVHGVDDDKLVDILPVGILPPNPVELLSNSRMGDLFEHLRHEYDYILVDCPPAEIVADARLISKYADMTLFVIRTGMFERSMLPEVERYAETQRYKNLSIILNGTNPNLIYNRKRYGYGYGYGYVHR